VTGRLAPEADWRTALGSVGIDPEAVLDTLSRSAGLPPACPIFLAGSIAEGLAVGSSDIDLYAICRPDELREGLLTGRDQVSVPLGGRHLDVTLLDPDWLNALLARLDKFCSHQPLSNAQADTFSTLERMTFHRLASGLPIAGPDSIATFRTAVSDHHLTLKRHCASQMIKRRKFSAQALADAGDYQNLLFICRDIADEAADLLLAAAGDGSVALKWRLPRLLMAYRSESSNHMDPECHALWPALRDPAATYFRISHFPPEDRLETSLHYARQVIGWADLVQLWSSAPAKISHEKLAFGLRAAAEAPFALRLDCSVIHADGAFLLQRLNSASPGWEISAQAAAFIAHLNFQPFDKASDGPGSNDAPWDVNALIAFLADEGFIESTEPAWDSRLA
jgi:hypothetical protein